MKKLHLTIIFIAAVTVLLAQSKISDKLWEDIIEAQEEDTSVEAIIFMEDKYDIQKLDKQLKEQKVTPHERAVIVNTELRQHANQTQKSLVDLLKSKASTEVIQYKTFWITNAIFIEAKPGYIIELADHPNIVSLEIDEQSELIKPVKSKPAPPKFLGYAEPGLKVINAHKMWKLGFTGEGTIVANLDTGVEGDHPALQSSWRGNNVPTAYAWYDPLWGSTLPTDLNGHGTHTMGIMIGLDSLTNDTIGVAFDSEWIAARTNYNVSYNLMAFEWFLDPDGDPETTDDIPDVISNQWGNSNQCSEVYLEAITNLEISGVVVIFVVGNDGPDAGTIVNPADLNATNLTVFSVGAIYALDPDLPIAPFSSRGPSPCTTGTGNSIKPEIVAPGTWVRSSWLGGGYEYSAGTSMAAPHVSGAIALLKQAFPEKTANELKQMLYDNARDLGPPGEDNTYGMGVVDVYLAYIANRYPGNPKPSKNFTTYSDYLTPSSVALSWIDPTELVGGGTLTNFEIQVWRNNDYVSSVSSGLEMYVDDGLVDGVNYQYELYTIDLDTDSLSIAAFSSVYCGGSPFPAPPDDLNTIFNATTGVTLSWLDPFMQSDGTPIDDLEKIYIYRNEEWIAEVDAGIETYIDTSSVNLNSTYFFSLQAVDNEIPENLSELTKISSCFTGDHPEILIWIGENAWGQSEISGETIYHIIAELMPSVYLSNNLYAFGNDLNNYNAIFMILGVYPFNHILQSAHGIDLNVYLNGGGNLYLEGSDCYNYDPTNGGFNVRPWFSLSTGSDGENDVFYVEGVNELDTVSLKYSGLNMYMDELIPNNSTSILNNPDNEDILGVWWDGFGSNGARTIGTVPSYGGLVDTSNSCFEEYMMCRYLNYFGYDFDCDSILLYCPCSCLPEGITFTTQAQIDSFQVNYPGCTEIEGDVIIGKDYPLTDVTNLNGLSSITSIGGYFKIYNNQYLQSLSGLNNITVIEESLSIGGWITDEGPAGNNLLHDLTGLNNLVSIGGDLGIRCNYSLNNLSGLDNLASIDGSLIIGEKFQDGMGGQWSTSGNPSLKNLSGLVSLSSIGNKIKIIGNDSLIYLTGLDNLSYVGGNLIIGDNNALSSLAGLENLNSIEGDLTIGFNNGGPGGQAGNLSLINIEALSNVISIGGNMQVKDNPKLAELTGLDNISPTSIADINISNNDSLFLCDVVSVCQYLIEPGGLINISNNAPGCNSQEEVDSLCNPVSVQELSIENNFTISPNPLNSNPLIQYKLHQNSHVTLKILDLSNQLVMSLVDEYQQQGDQRMIFNSDGLKSGIYFCVLKTSQTKETKKIIKLN